MSKAVVQKCEFCGTKSADVTNEVFISNENVVRHYEICPKCLLRAFRKIIDMFMEEDEYKVSNVIQQVLDETYCDMIHDKKASDIKITEENSKIYLLKQLEDEKE